MCPLPRGSRHQTAHPRRRRPVRRGCRGLPPAGKGFRVHLFSGFPIQGILMLFVALRSADHPLRKRGLQHRSVLPPFPSPDRPQQRQVYFSLCVRRRGTPHRSHPGKHPPLPRIEAALPVRKGRLRYAGFFLLTDPVKNKRFLPSRQEPFIHIPAQYPQRTPPASAHTPTSVGYRRCCRHRWR